jgi:TonB-dependent starch-binding outer membrane protein SusC
MGIHVILKKIGILMLVLPLLAFVPNAVEVVQAQQNTVQGQVTDAATGEPIPGVNIVIQGTAIGTATDLNGEYSLNVPALDRILVVSAIGFQSQEIAIEGRTTINVELSVAAIAIDDVVVVGYGTLRSRDLTGSVGTVNMQNVEAMPITSPDQMLQGQIAGVNVTTTSGQPGSAPMIQVRGIGSIGAGAQPLFVVDGFALPQSAGISTASRFRNPLADIPPGDIASITVLKDASATAIYGSRASNGVVIIETRRGRSGAPQVNVSMSSGVSRDMDRTIYRMANARQFAEFQNYIWTARVAEGSASEVPPEYRNPEQYGEGTDWFALTRRDYAPRYDFQASISGGSESVRSYFSAGFQQEDGIIYETGFSRVNFRANLEADLSSRFTAGLNFAPSITHRNNSGSGEDRGSSIGSPMMMSPLNPAYDSNGELCPFPSQCADFGQTGLWTHANPLYRLQALEDDYSGIRILGTAFVDYELIDGLNLRTSLNVDWGNEERNFFNPSMLGGINAPPPTVPFGQIENGQNISYLSETTLNYRSELGPGNLEALVGFTAQTGQTISQTFSGNFPDDDIRTLNVASNINGSTNEQEWSMASVLSRVNYNLLDRYIFTATFRADGSSRFGQENRWGYFPSGAVAWNILNEPGFAGLTDTFDELRVRASFGLTGNNQIGNYSALGVIQTQDYLYGSSVAGGRGLTSMANDLLGWERNKEWNAGIEFAILDHRLRFNVDGYIRTTEDMLLGRTLPTSSGFGSVTDNLGSMENRGFEIGLNTINVVRENIFWSTDLNFSLNRNKVLSLPDGEPLFGAGGEGHPQSQARVGRPIGEFIGYVVDGIWQNEQEIANNPSAPGDIPGNLRFRDVNGDGEINPGPPEVGGDFDVIGNPHPKFTYGITNNFRVGNFDVRATITGRYGGDVYMREYFRTAKNIDGLFNVAAAYVEGFWRSESEPGSGIHPTPLGGGEQRRRYRGEHTHNVADGSNLWLRNLMVRYNLPAGFAGITRSSIYVSGTNLFIISGYDGNPEVQRDSAGDGHGIRLNSDWFNYPLTRTFTFGINIDL